MPADASIYSMIRPQQQGPGPLEQYGQVLSLKNMMGQGELHALQLDKARQEIGDDTKVRDIFARAQAEGRQPTANEISAVSPTKGMAYGKQMTEAEVARANLEKTKIETHGMQIKQLRDQLAAVADDAGLAALRENTTKLYGPQAAAGIPPTVNDPNFAQWRDRTLMTADKAVVSMEARLTDERTRSEGMANRGVTVRGQNLTDERTRAEGAANRGVTMRGQNMTDTRTREANDQGKTQVVTDADGNVTIVNKGTGEARAATGPDGQPLKGKEKPMTEFQGKAQMFGTRAAEAHNILNALEGTAARPGLAVKQSLENMPLTGGALGAIGNKMLGADSQKIDQAQRNFVNAVLRNESGAAINQSEFDSAKKQYFPQVGDSPEVIKQKRANRESAIAGFQLEAGKEGGARIAGAREARPGEKTGKVGVNPAQLSDAELKRELGL